MTNKPTQQPKPETQAWIELRKKAAQKLGLFQTSIYTVCWGDEPVFIVLPKDRN
jgi:hypothetical protein